MDDLEGIDLLMFFKFSCYDFMFTVIIMISLQLHIVTYG